MSILIDYNQVFISNIIKKITYENIEIDDGLIRHMVLNSLRAYKVKFGEEYGDLVICCDGRNYWRKKIFPYYKAGRRRDRIQTGLDWNEIFETLNKIRDEIKDYFPYKVVDVDSAEADDIIGTLAKQADESELDVYIVSGDKDFMQLVNEHIFLYSPSGRNAELKVYDSYAVEEKWGVPPEKIIDLLGLMGDSSDNVPAVMGVGKKTAVKLLKEYGTLESALDHADMVKNKRAREGLQNGREKAVLSQELVTIKTNMDLEINYTEMATNGFDLNKLDELFRDLEFQVLQTHLISFYGKVLTNV